MCDAPFVFLLTLYQVALELVIVYDINITQRKEKTMSCKNFERDVASDYPCSFTHGDNEDTKEWALWKAQKRASMRNIRLNATSIINDLQNLLDLYDKEHDERMYKKTMVLLTSLNNFIVESYNKDREEENSGLQGFRWPRIRLV